MNTIKWEHLSSGTGTISGFISDKIYLLMPFSTGKVELDWRYDNSDEWHFVHDKMIFPDMETAKQWCEMHHATGADK